MILTFIFLLQIFTFTLLFLIPAINKNLIQFVGFSSSCIVLILSCILLVLFNSDLYYFQHIVTYELDSTLLNLSFSFGLDGISIYFFVLSSFLIFLCTAFVWKSRLLKEYYISLNLISFLLLIIFSCLDLLAFYVFFEAILIPMYLLIGLWGSRERKIRAVYLFFFYTLVGSLLMLIGILYIYSKFGTFNLELLFAYSLTFEEQCWLWLAFFFSFASKVPLFPFHIWLPEAHVEAPTIGSVLLAGIMLKLGIYGFIRFSLTLFPDGCLFFSPLIYWLCTTGIIYASLSAVRQTDLKRIVAYSSIAHMNLVVLGIFSFNIIGLEGAVLQSISHGFVSGAMFLLIGMLYEKYHSRTLYYYGGLAQTMPVYSILLFFFTIANIAVPGTSSFVGEFILLLGIYKTNMLCCIVGSVGIILCGIYSLWTYNRIVFGNLKTIHTSEFNDLNFREFSILVPLLILVLFMGIYPSFFSYFIHLSIGNLFIATFY